MHCKVQQTGAGPRRGARPVFAAVAVILLAGSGIVATAQAQAPTSTADGAQNRSGAAAAADPIKGADTMSDKGRSGPDGWSWAPVSRTQGASANAPGEQKSDQQHAAQQAKVPATNSQSPGMDPGTPLPTRQPGPAGTVPSSPEPH